MKTLTAFVAKSFQPTDRPKTERVEQFLSRFKRLGFDWKSAEPGEVESVSAKVQRLIDDSDVFVGILTKRKPIRPQGNRIQQAFKILRESAADTRWSAPPWVLQESGYAIKANKHLILFVEIGVDIGELQGDQEYIPFDPARPDSAFAKAHEMLSDLIARNAQLITEVVTTRSEIEAGAARSEPAIPVVDQGREAPQVAELAQEEEPGFLKSWTDLWAAIEDRDIRAAEKVFEEGLRAIPADAVEKIIVWKALYYNLTYRIGREGSRADLLELQENHPNNSLPSALLAGSLKKFEQYEDAARYYFAASSLGAPEDRAPYVISGAKCLCSAKRPEEARKRVESLLRSDGLSAESRISALKVLYSISRDLGQAEYAFSLGELILQKNPGDIEFRGSLAYDYLDTYAKCAIYHFELVTREEQRNPEPYWINNLGYAYSLVDLPIHAARQYARCNELKMPRGTRNLANILVDSGMVDAATELLNAAKDWSDPDGLIPEALARVHERTAEENIKKEEAIESIRAHREFLCLMGVALTEDCPANIDGSWDFRFATVRLARDGEQIHGNEEKSVKPNTLAALMSGNFGGNALTSGNRSTTRQVVVSGTLTGRVCRYTRWTEPSTSDTSGLYPPPRDERSGFLIFDPDGRTASVGEYKEGKPHRFSTGSKTA
jgi:hypothetical protein